RSPATGKLAPVLGAEPRSGAPGRRIPRRPLDRRSWGPVGTARWYRSMAGYAPQSRLVNSCEMPHRSVDREVPDEGLDAGLSAHHPAHAVAARAALRPEGDRDQAGDGAPPLHVRRPRPAGAPAGERARAAGGPAGRPGRHAGLEQLPAPGAVL